MNPWPIDDPRHNLILLGKELLLLEGHLGDPSRHCPSCVLKHTLTCAGLCEEAARMPGARPYAPLWVAVDRVVAGVLQHQPVARPADSRVAPADHMTTAVRDVRRQVLQAILENQRAKQAPPARPATQGGCACGGKCGGNCGGKCKSGGKCNGNCGKAAA